MKAKNIGKGDMNMKTKKYIGKKEYGYLTHLSKTYASIVETSKGYSLLQNTFKGSRYAIHNILDKLYNDFSEYLTLEDLIMWGNSYVLNYRHAASLENRVYWEGAYDEILKLIEIFFDIKLRREI